MSKKIALPLAIVLAMLALLIIVLFSNRRPRLAKTFAPQTTSSVHLTHLEEPFLPPDFLKSNSARYAVSRAIESLAWNTSYKLDVEIAKCVKATEDGSNNDDAAEFLKNCFRVKESRNTSFEKLASHLDRGYPAIVTLQDGTKFHTAIVSGYYKSNDRFTHWQICDAGLLEGKQTHEEFATRWSCHGLFGYTKHCLLLTPKASRRWPKKWSLHHRQLTDSRFPKADYLQIRILPNQVSATRSVHSDELKQAFLKSCGVGVILVASLFATGAIRIVKSSK